MQADPRGELAVGESGDVYPCGKQTTTLGNSERLGADVTSGVVERRKDGSEKEDFVSPQK